MPDLKVGDEAWVINSYRTRAFLCKVTAVTEDRIHVQNVDKDQKQAFYPDGRPFPFIPSPTGEPKLVAYDDSEALRLEAEAMHREYRERVNQILRLLPGTPEGFQQLRDLVDEWEDAAVGDADAG